MEKLEAELKAAAMRELERQCPNYIVLLQQTAGAPDRAIVGAGRTSFWEFKHATPDFASPGIQELFCNRLAVQGYCRYVIWQESAAGTGKRTMIVHPREVHRRVGYTVQPETFCIGFNHHWLVDQIRRAHRL